MRGGRGSTTHKNRPAICFLAHRGGNPQTSVSSTATIDFNQTDLNVGGWFSTASGTFAPPAGAYEIGAQFRLATGAVANAQIQVAIAKDGTTHRMGVAADTATSAFGLGSSVTTLINTTGTSFFTARVVFAGTATGEIDGSAVQSFFWAKEITR